ncbi:MAG: hypothetical protein NC397_09160 [Clostridium sp.]|nr:hypothetical protein [Clostridium sp.]
MTDENWNAFWKSGSIYDYLNFKENEKVKDDDNLYQGFSNQRADNRGE